MADSEVTGPTFPSDIPWRLVAHSVLSPAQDATPAFGVSPSLGVFVNVVPRSETQTDFPNHRMLLLKLSPTLTGMNFVFPIAHVFRPYYFPCVGAVLYTRLSLVTAAGEREWPNVQPSHLSQRGIAIRDVYPKHQDYVVNELLGEESLERQSTRTVATKAWNVSGAASATVGVFSLNIAGGLSETTVTETAEERAQRQSRQTEIHNIYHLLTAYDVGGGSTTLEIAPRPFERQSWDLVQGFRTLEGLQDFLVLAQVPFSVRHVLIESQLTLGFRGGIPQPPQLPIIPPPPPRPEISQFVSNLAVYIDREWQAFAASYNSYLGSLDFYHSQFDIPLVLTTTVGTRGWAQLFWGADPCGDEQQPNPCDFPLGTREAGLESAVEQTTVRPLVREYFVSPLRWREDPMSRQESANRHMMEMFRAVRAGSRELGADRVPISESQALRGAFERYLEDISLYQTPDASLSSFLAQLSPREKQRASDLGLRRLSDLALSGPRWRGTVSAADANLRNALLALVMQGLPMSRPRGVERRPSSATKKKKSSHT